MNLVIESVIKRLGLVEGVDYVRDPEYGVLFSLQATRRLAAEQYAAGNPKAEELLGHLAEFDLTQGR